MKLYGKVTGYGGRGDGGSVTKGAEQSIESWVQTERGRITTTLRPDGSYRVTIQRVRSHAPAGTRELTIAYGNVHEELDADDESRGAAAAS